MHRLGRTLQNLLFHKFISIRIKFVLSMTMVILIFGSISLVATYKYVLNLSHDELVKKATLMADVLGDQLLNLVLVNDLSSVNSLIGSMKKDDDDILYIQVLDRNRSTIGHTFGGDRIPEFLSKNTCESGLRYFVDKSSDVSVLQVTEGFMDGKMGAVVVGLNESVLAERGGRIVSRLVVIFALLLLGVAIASMFLSYFILYPIYQVMRGLESFSPGQPLPDLKIVFNDEIKLLSIKFREMTERLNTMINEFKHTQLQMIQTEKLASIGTLASGVAHEINNPIAGIEICTHRLQKHKVLDAKQEEYVKLIAEAAQHIKTVVRSLLSYARQPDQKIELVDICSVAKFSLKLLHYRLQKKEIVVTEHMPGHPCYVRGIRAQLVQVVVNGIINAVDASDAGGSIAVDILDKREMFEIAIVDNGRGIDPAIAGKVFDPFFTTKGNQGTGLGLYVSYNLVTAHNGTITLAPGEKVGAKLSILLPRVEQEKETTEINSFTSEGI
jgi:two-component system, NtrC family, sensor kinase